MMIKRFAWIWLVALGACAAPVARDASPPQSAPEIAGTVALDTAAVDSAQLIRDISVLAHDSMEGRLVGTPGSLRAQRFLLRRFSEMGLDPFGAEYAQPFTFARGVQQVQGVNILGLVRGTERPDRYIVVTAHYDHLGVRNGEIYVGADDNASGTAGLLAIATHFRQNPPRHSIIFAALDAEEGGLRGARAFVANPPVARDAIALNINLDMIGRNDANELYVAGTHHYPQLLPFVQRVAGEAEVKLIPGHDTPNPARRADWTMASDHGAFHEVGIPFLYFGVEDHPDYHRPTDRFEGIQHGFFLRAVRTVLSAVRLIDGEL
jgi:Zn-dependent M28 family amino/carboxypeptidase